VLPLERKVKLMETAYWLGRNRASLANARAATGAEARLIHYELAGRYSIKAANEGTMLDAGAVS
jgi:hypothetical protein